MTQDLKSRLSNPDSLVSLLLGIAVIGVVGVLIFNYVKERGQLGPSQQAQNQNGTPTPPMTTQGGSHTVAAGETLWTIAEKHVGSGYNWVDIAQANNLANADDITVGQKLTIPKMTRRLPPGTPSPETTSAPTAKGTNVPTAQPTTDPTKPAATLSPSGKGSQATTPTMTRPADGKYTVKSGDSLWKISVAIYGNGYRWSEIARLNNLANPDIIHAGNVLTLP